jgi:hypothetical protein
MPVVVEGNAFDAAQAINLLAQRQVAGLAQPDLERSVSLHKLNVRR